MTLKTDEQTIADLQILARRDGGGIYDIYNRSHTRGGEALLEEMFRVPLSDAAAINRRSGIIESFVRLNLSFPYNTSLFDMVEKYLAGHDGNEGYPHSSTLLGEKEVRNGVTAIIALIHLTKSFIGKEEVAGIIDYAPEREAIAALLADPALEPVLKESAKENKLSYAAVTAYDGLLRISQRSKVADLLQHIYHLDVYISVAQTAAERKFIFAKALDKGQGILKAEGVYHPSLKAPIGNDIVMDPQRNVIFLTGANMAGKSTFLRALSTALYVAHIGFPVAARNMEFAVVDGIYTTINLPDNLGIGASHFYAEVLRVKKVATELSTGKSFFILFDELFRGTNVKDAYEATVAVIRGFARKNNSLFIISSHIVEAGIALKQDSGIGFLYLPTRMKGHVPEYTYTLEQGITDDRHGMIIIRNEGILETLEKGKKINR